VVGIVVAVHAVAPDRVHVGHCLGQPAADDLDVALVQLVVDGIRLGHLHDVADLHNVAGDQTELGDLLGRERHQTVVRQRPDIVALVHEVLQAQAAPAVLDQVGRPRAEVLHTPDPDLGTGDVHPVVRKAEPLRHDQRDGEEVAVAQVGRRGLDLGRRRRLHDADQAADRHRGHHVRGRQAHRAVWGARDDGGGALLVALDLGDLTSSSTEPPRSLTCSAQRSHIRPGPDLGYWNSSMRLAMSFWLRRGSSAFSTAENSERFLMRCAAQSAWISVAGTPQTFSV